MKYATCIPSTCNQEDLVNLFNQVSDLPYTACRSFCANFDVEKGASFWIFTIFLTAYVIFAVFATVFDFFRSVYYEQEASDETNSKIRAILAFSFWTNAETILSVKEHKPTVIRCMDCLRFLTMCWVIIGHSLIMFTMGDSIEHIQEVPKIIWSQLLLSAAVAVDTFFVISGTLLSYAFFRNIPDLARLRTWIIYYVHRYLRITPALMIFLGFFAVYTPYIQGPVMASQFNGHVMQAKGCETSWWRNMLYINNFDADLCYYSTTWYLAVDMQLYITAPIFLILLYFSFYVGAFFMITCTMASCTAVYILYAKYDLPADLVGNGNIVYLFSMMYSKPWIRCPTYFMGLIIGYLIAFYGGRKIELSSKLTTFFWFCCFTIIYLVIFSKIEYDRGEYWSVVTRATYFNFSRIGWGVAICWIIMATHFGWGGFITNILCHPIWQPLGKLSYSTYIIHWMVILYFINTFNQPLHYANLKNVYLAYSVPSICLCFFLAFFWSCLFELPIINLEKMLFAPKISKSISEETDALPPEDIEVSLDDEELEDPDEKSLRTLTKTAGKNVNVPVVLWHGMGDFCCNPLSMGSVKKLLEQEIPGVYVHSLQLGSSYSKDIEHGFFANVNELVYMACVKIQNDRNLKYGYNAIGFSQGGQFMRAVAQRCPNPPMKNLISIGGQQQGVFGMPYCIGDNVMCNIMRKMIDFGAYTSFVQKKVVQAQYWHDPINEDQYKNRSTFLADINNENKIKSEYKKNLLQIKNLVLVKFSDDHMVVPRESSWFGFYKTGDIDTILSLNETDLYKEDRIGIRKLYESGRLHFVEADGDHLQLSHEKFVEIINKYLK
ncbi:unnamed protein product [Caenorhabditis bovis]|uniref:Palmitoyl-protein thioesterase 1 n=1 Tax=Caenorhabditis bovis TaxID=2654633 RepID=A0A8S1EB58_9PELO|nr:unnamed protein product [Caenorhabditis bovis]